MKPVNTFLLSAFAVALPLVLSAQTSNIIGRWQLTRKSNCMEGSFAHSDSVQNLVDDMHSRTSATAQVVSFRENATAEESTRILNSNRSANQKKFFYKFNGDMLLVLDKKTQTISDNYMVEKLTADTLILSNSARPCEMKIFVKIKDDQAN